MNAGADSFGGTVAVPAPVIIPLPESTTNVAGGAPQALPGVGSPGIGSPGAAMSMTTGLRRTADGHHHMAHGQTRESSGGIQVGTGYATTGGGYQRRAHRVEPGSHAEVSSSLQSGTINSSGVLSGGALYTSAYTGPAGTKTVNPSATGSIPGSYPPKTASSMGTGSNSSLPKAKWSIQGVGSGTAHIAPSSGDYAAIGGECSYTLVVSGGGGASGGGSASVKPNSVTWTINAPGVLWNPGQVPPNPSNGQTAFNSSYYTQYNLAAQTGSTVTFCWGATTGKATFTVNATAQLTKNGQTYTTPVKVTAVAFVSAPGWVGSISTRKSAQYYKDTLRYASFNFGTANPPQYSPGIKWELSPTYPGTLSGGYGSFQTVQLLTNYAAQIKVPLGKLAGTYVGYYRNSQYRRRQSQIHRSQGANARSGS